MKQDFFDIITRDAIGLLSTMDQLNHVSNTSFPPHNIVKVNDTTYRVELAIAGYTENDIDVTVEDGKLKIVGLKKTDEKVEYLHKGIAYRNFYKEFILSQDIEIGEAELNNGLLSVTLKHIIPESKKPKKIAIKTGEKQFLTE